LAARYEERKLRKLIVSVSVLLAALIAVSVALAAGTTTLEIKASPNKVSKSKSKLTPIRLAINVGFGDTDPAAPQPPYLKKVVIRFNEGGTYNGKLFPKCKASALLAKGPSACPKGSKIGKGTATAAAQPVLPSVNAVLTLFNGELKGGVPTVIIYAVPDISSPLTISGTVKKGPKVSCGDGGKCDYVLTFDVPDIPTLPGQPNAAVITTKTQTDNVFVKKKKRVKGKKKTVKIPLIGAPTKCTGKWVADSNVTFGDGSTATAKTSAPCKK
jgi:hypothetical protein